MLGLALLSCFQIVVMFFKEMYCLTAGKTASAASFFPTLHLELRMRWDSKYPLHPEMILLPMEKIQIYLEAYL